MIPPARKLTVDGVEYVRKDLVPPGVPKNLKAREYTVLGFGAANDGQTHFMRLKGFKSVKYKVGEKIMILAHRPERKKREPKPADAGNTGSNPGV